jgi:predicted ArsR family transcriptional regulator
MPKTKRDDGEAGGRRGDIPNGRLLSAVLSQPVRRSALRHLLVSEGSGLDDLARALGVTLKQARYHLGILRAHGLATVTGDPRRQANPSCFAATCKEETEVARRLGATERKDREALRERHLATARPVERAN